MLPIDEVMLKSQARAWKEIVDHIDNKDPFWYKNGGTGIESIKNTIDKLIEDAHNEGYRKGFDDADADEYGDGSVYGEGND